jgi:predicted RNA-binding protein YlxR (DUF448 family)
VVCRRQLDKRQLTRVVRTPDAGVVLDPTGKRNGRGAYICEQQACWEKALGKAQVLNQALNTQLSPAELAALSAAHESLVNAAPAKHRPEAAIREVVVTTP